MRVLRTGWRGVSERRGLIGLKAAARRLAFLGFPAAGMLALEGCRGEPSLLDPAGPAARRIEGLWWLLFAISAAVFVIVLALILAAVRRSGSGGGLDGGDGIEAGTPRWGSPFILIAGVAVPTVILGGVFLISLADMGALGRAGRSAAMTIDVVGHDWWWEIRYPEAGVVSANEIHIPAREPVRLRLSTGDVIHSLWVPQLQVKTDMVPGVINETWLQADRPGRYRGQCAEYCGLQHARMAFFVVAQAPEEFRSWLAGQARPAPDPETADELAGREAFLDSTCVACHAIRGTAARASVGPDLTHLASRETIAAGVAANTRDSLARFITRPQEVKPGVAMPPSELGAGELEALLDYLGSLE